MNTNKKKNYLLFNVNLVASACRLMTSKMKRLCPMQPIISRFSDTKRAPNVLTGHPNRFISVVASLLNFSGKEKLQSRRRLPEAARAHFSPLTLRYLLLLITPNKPRDALSITNLEQLQDRSPWHWTFPYHVLAKGAKDKKPHWAFKFWVYIPVRKLSDHPVECGPRNHRLRVVSNFATRRESASPRVSRVCVYFARSLVT